MKWNITKLVVAGGLAIVYLVLGLSGGVLQAILGFPGAAGFVMSIASAMMLAFCCLLIKKFGAATIMTFIYSICVLPLPTLGAPGFLPKIVIGTSAGLIADTIYALLKKKEKIACMGIGAITQPLIGFEILGLGFLFSMPGIEKLAGLMLSPLFVVLAVLLGVAGGLLGWFVFDKLKDTAIVRRIQGA